jgi:hypothetical protein
VHLLAFAERDAVDASVDLRVDGDGGRGQDVAEALEVDGHVALDDGHRDDGDDAVGHRGGILGGGGLRLGAAAGISAERKSAPHQDGDGDDDADQGLL